MFRGYAPLLVLWVGGLAVAVVIAFAKGQVDLKTEHSRQLSQVSQLSTGLRIAFDNFAERNASDLARIIEVEITQEQMGNWLSDSAFQSVALIDQEVSGTWKVSWARSKAAASAVQIYQDWLSKLPLDKISGDFVSWNRVEIPGQRPSLVLGVQLRLKTANSESTQIALGQLPLDHLAALTDPLKSDGTEIFLVDSAGYSLTFPNPQYVGSYLDVHPLVNAAVKLQSISDTGDFRNLAGEPTIGGYERVKNSNVYVIVNLPTTPAATYVTRQLSESAFVILGILLFLSIPMALIRRSDRERLAQLRQTLASVEPVAPSNPGPSQRVQIKNETSQAATELVEVARKEVFERFASAVFQQLKGPVYSALAKSGRLVNMGTNPQAQEVLSGLEADLRRTKLFVEGLGRTLRANERQGMEVNVSKVIEAELARNAELLQKKNLEVEFTPAQNLVVKSHPEDIHKMVRAFLKRGTSLEGGPQGKRKLIVRLDHQGPIVRTNFLYSGHRIGESQVEKIFDIKSPDDIDLSEARGLASTWNGQIYAEDSLAGLRFILELPFAPGYEMIRTNTGIKEVRTEKPKAPPSKESLEAAAKQLEQKKVDETLDRVLPPAPAGVRQDVSVVEDLTMTRSKTAPENAAATEVTLDNSKDIKIRKPRVRIE